MTDLADAHLRALSVCDPGRPLRCISAKRGSEMNEMTTIQERAGVWRAPGRANLMGEHTDYNQGLVLPFAIAQGVTVTAVRRDDGLLVLRSRQEPGQTAAVALDSLAPGAVTGWAAYPAGVAWALREAGHRVPGATIGVNSDLPAGAGLSSSAGLECATALALTGLAGLSVPRPELVELTRRAENEFIGVPSGIMDQSASLLCETGHVLLLDCGTRETSQVPFDPAVAGAGLLVIDTRAGHAHAGGDYARRRAECEEAARLMGVPFLGCLTDADDVGRLADPVLRRRARHVVTDSARVLAAVDLLRSAPADPGAYQEIGALLAAAHRSLRYDFEVSWPQADVTVDAAVAAGALGARMIGGGFGGSVLALVPADAGPAVRRAIADAFARQGWAAPEFIATVPSGGASRADTRIGR
ncbi:MAG TPA: galactokinase [Trebonia sp.]